MTENRAEERSGGDTHRRACAAIRRAVERVHRVILGGPADEIERGRFALQDDEFIRQVRDWLAGVRSASALRWQANEAWHHAYRHYLASVVGSRASTESGRAAGQCGYRILAVEFQVLFGRVVSTYPSIVCGDCTDESSPDLELVAMLCVVPETVRRDPRFVPRLLGAAARLAANAPKLLDDDARDYLAELARIASASRMMS